MSQRTVEVLNTDAEGRLVLCDVMWYIQEMFKPKIMVDMATLTGGLIIALGYSYAGLFTEDEEILKDMKDAGQHTGEEVWHLPLHQDFNDCMKSDHADIANLSKKGAAASSCTAAHFFEKTCK